MGLSADVQQWEPSTVSHWRLPKCVVSGDAFDQYIYGADDAGRLALTMDMTGKGSFLVIRDDNAQYAPYAFVVDRSKCRVLGRGTVVGVRGQWSSGYRGMLRPPAKKRAPLPFAGMAYTSLNSDRAMRSRSRQMGSLRELMQYPLILERLPYHMPWLGTNVVVAFRSTQTIAASLMMSRMMKRSLGRC